jgi:hypothetical protein
MTDDEEKQEFEKYAQNKWWFNGGCYPDGGYSDNATRAAFDVWSELS